MNELKITDRTVDSVLKEIRRYGERTNETGGFLGSSSVDAAADLVALAGEEGIRRGQDLFQVNGGAIGHLFDWASERGTALWAQFHSHRRRAFLSPVDLEYGFAVEGFISCVVPFYADPPVSPTDWGWWRFEAGAWVAITAPGIVGGGVEVVSFDQGGVDGI